ncbi:hypothetical protein LSH36_246g04081, partial [Paralvinella palmiformis]
MSMYIRKWRIIQISTYCIYIKEKLHVVVF